MKRWWMLMLVIPAVAALSCSRTDMRPGGSGLIEATEVTISSEAAGRVERLYIDEGSLVRIGDTVALIDTVTLALRIDQAAALRRAAETRLQSASIQIEKAALDYDLAQKEYGRIKSLMASGSANQQQYDKAQNILDQARLGKQAAQASRDMSLADLQKIDSDLALLQKQLADCRPVSPVAGTVMTKYSECGELAAIGKPLFKIARLDTVWVKVYLPPSDLTRIKLGAQATIDPEDGQNKVLTGIVSWISSEAEFTPKNVQTKEARADLVYAVKIIIPNTDGRLKTGMPVVVSIL